MLRKSQHGIISRHLCTGIFLKFFSSLKVFNNFISLVFRYKSGNQINISTCIHHTRFWIIYMPHWPFHVEKTFHNVSKVCNFSFLVNHNLYVINDV